MRGMRRTIILVGTVLLLITGCGTKSSEAVSQTPDIKYSGETNKGTPIVDDGNTDYDINSVHMKDTPDSSCFSEIGYDESNEILVVTFRETGATYSYFDFSQSDWNDFSTAESLGGYFNQYIKGNYDCVRW